MYVWMDGHVVQDLQSTKYLLRVLDYEHDVVLDYVLYLGACIRYSTVYMQCI